MSDSNQTAVSVESEDGRILTGVGVTPDALERTMERHAPEPPAGSAPAEASGAATLPSAESESQADRDAAGRFQPRGRQRYSALTAERDAAAQRATAAEKERDELRQRLEAASRAPAAPTPAAPPASAAPPEKFTFPDYYTYLSTHPDVSYEDWTEAKVDALTDWKLQRSTPLDIDARIRQSIEADRASRSLADRLAQSDVRGRQAYPDFDAVLASPHVQAPNWPLDKLRAIAALDELEHVRYALAKDPALAESLRTEPDPVQFGIRLARVLSAVPSVASPASTGPRAVPPPLPMQPVGTGTRTTVLPSAALVQKAGFDFDKSGYREKRAAERGVRR